MNQLADDAMNLRGQSATDENILQLSDVRKSFGSLTVLDGLSLSVNRGEVFGFLGRNGAGKSTAIRILMGISRLDGGHISIFGKPLLEDVIGIRQRIGYVAQDQNMYPWMTPKVLGRFVRGFYPRWDEKRYLQLVDDFSLPLKRRIGTFSGGMKAKLALTLALATRPELLILDEPTAGMDPVARREFLDLVRDQTMSDGATTFFSTHLIDEIEAVADRIGIVESGRTVYEGDLDPLRNSIASWSVAMNDYVPGSLPGEFAQQRLRVLQEGERQGRWVMTMQFSQEDLASREIILNTGWRHDPMSLEDVFIAVVAKA
ncbi:MAG: ABC transporter ATP-binding protein [Granulosicoccus sp.]